MANRDKEDDISDAFTSSYVTIMQLYSAHNLSFRKVYTKTNSCEAGGEGGDLYQHKQDVHS